MGGGILFFPFSAISRILADMLLPTRTPMLVAVLGLACALAGCYDDDDDGDDGCTAESCEERCAEEHATELADCNEICGIDAKCLSSGTCKCEFLPCDHDACATWCQENEGTATGGCGAVSGNVISCDCY